MLELVDVTSASRLGRIEKALLQGVSLTMAAGETVCVVGVRRSGKSTLLRIAAGLERPSSGEVRFGGRDLSRCPAVGRGIGFVRPTLRREGGAVVDQVASPLLGMRVSRKTARSAARQLLHAHGILELADLLPSELCAGERMLVGVARAMITQPKILIADDPTDGVDLLSRDLLYTNLKRIVGDGTGVLVATSDMGAARGADQAFSLSEGRLLGPATPQKAAVLPFRRQAG